MGPKSFSNGCHALYEGKTTLAYIIIYYRRLLMYAFISGMFLSMLRSRWN